MSVGALVVELSPLGRGELTNRSTGSEPIGGSIRGSIGGSIRGSISELARGSVGGFVRGLTKRSTGDSIGGTPIGGLGSIANV